MSAAVVIGPSATTNMAMTLLLLPLLGFRPRRQEAWFAQRAASLVLVLGLSTAALVGCGGGDSSTTIHELGSKTVLVTAIIGAVSSSVALNVNIQ